MSAQTELFKLAMLQVSLSPNPFTAGAYFNQTLDLSSGTLHLYLGGANLSTHAIHLSAWVDANSDTLRVTAAARDGAAPFSLRVQATSTRPATNWSYTPSFSCGSSLALPDTYVDPLPPSQPLHPASPLGDAAFRHAGGEGRPLRALFRPGGALRRPGAPTAAAFQPGSLLVYHRNSAAEGHSLAATLAQQGLADLLPTTPDHWTDLQSGFVLDGDDGPPLLRVDAHTLSSAAPAPFFSLRATVLAVQTDAASEWVADVAALVATTPPSAAARAAHEAWWEAWWGRSYIAVNASNFPGEVIAAATPPQPPGGAASSLPVPGAVLWLRASSLSSQANNTAVMAWGEPSLPTATLAQPNASLQPTFISDAFGEGAPAVRFDGERTFLESATLALPGPDSTHFAVFRDGGSATACCSGVLFWKGAFVGLSTVAANAADDDDLSPSAGRSPVVSMVDFPGSNAWGSQNIDGRAVMADAVYSGSGAVLAVDGCEQAAAPPVHSGSTGVQVGTRNNEMARFFKGDVGELIVYPRSLNASEVALVRSYLAAQWPAVKPRPTCSHKQHDEGFTVSQMYAITRYTQAIQARNTMWPIKFNGMAFLAAMGTEGEADTRDWGVRLMAHNFSLLCCCCWRASNAPPPTHTHTSNTPLAHHFLPATGLQLVAKHAPSLWRNASRGRL